MSASTAPPATIAARDQPHPLAERPMPRIRGTWVVRAGGLAVIGTAALLSLGIQHTQHGDPSAWPWIGCVLLIVVATVAFRGLVSVQPGDAVVVQLFGRYLGTVREPGLNWVLPHANRRRISVKIRSFETGVSKVNDADGNPIEIAVVTIWEVTDTALAVFAVEDVAAFVAIQAEIAVRQIASTYPYDDLGGTGKPCLRASVGEVTTLLTAEIAARTAAAGVQVSESRLTQLNYAPEIAHAMLRRQQADAVVAARQKIVDGAVSMVETALERLASDDIVEFDEERKAAMVSNMLVVLCSDQATHPVINTGTLYH
jgi:regulator of protease activity HflC (stomatin/prohibitin superfamily)